MPDNNVGANNKSDEKTARTTSSPPVLPLRFIFCSEGPLETSSASQIRRNFEALPDNEVARYGTRGFPKEVTTIELDPDRMVAYNVSCLDDVIRIIEGARSLNDISETDLSFLADVPIRLKDIATVTVGYENHHQVFCKDGRQSVTFPMIPAQEGIETQIFEKLTMNLTLLQGEILTAAPPPENRLAVGFNTNRFSQSAVKYINNLLEQYHLQSFLLLNSVDSTAQNAVETYAQQQWFTVWAWLNVPTDRLQEAERNLAAVIASVQATTPGLFPDRVFGMDTVNISFENYWADPEGAPYTRLLNYMQQNVLFRASWLRLPMTRNKITLEIDERRRDTCGIDSTETSTVLSAALDGIDGVLETGADSHGNYRIFLGPASKRPQDLNSVSFRCSGNSWMRLSDIASIVTSLTVYPYSIEAPEVIGIFEPGHEKEVVLQIEQWLAESNIKEAHVTVAKSRY